MSAIFHLSKYILLPIYSEWLDASDFCHTDTAVCNHLERRHFLHLISHESVKFPGLEEEAVCTKYLKWIATRNMRITHLVIEKQLLIRIFNKSLPSFVHLKHLVAKNYDSNFSERLCQLLGVCPQLESFHLSTSKAFGCEIIETLSHNCRKLQSIELVYNNSKTGCTSVSDDIMVELATSCPCLTAVKLSNFVNVTGTFITTLAKNDCLKVLSLKKLPLLTAEQLDLLVARCPDMIEISLKNCKLLTVNDYCRILTKCSNLRSMCLRNGIDSRIPRQFFSMDTLMHAVHITTLKLCSMNVTDDALEMISITCSKLVILDMTREYYLTHDGFMHIANNCRYLTELSLVSCFGMTDAVVAAIATTAAAKFIRLNLNDCRRLTDISLQHVMNTCHNLTSLSIGYNYNYTLSATVYTKLLEVCPKLLFLDISGTSYNFMKPTRYAERLVRSFELYMLFTDAIKPDTSLRELRLIGMKMKPGVIGSVKETHKTLKVVHNASRSRYYDDSD